MQFIILSIHIHVLSVELLRYNSRLVLLIEVSFVEGSSNIIKYQNGTRKVSLVGRCPLYVVPTVYMSYA